jgi:hypothetical protein
VTGFTIEGEVVLNVFEKPKSDKVIPVVDAVTKVGANYSSPMHPFDDHSITAGRVITGANPASARSTAERVVKAFDGLQEGESTLKIARRNERLIGSDASDELVLGSVTPPVSVPSAVPSGSSATRRLGCLR